MPRIRTRINEVIRIPRTHPEDTRRPMKDTMSSDDSQNQPEPPPDEDPFPFMPTWFNNLWKWLRGLFRR